MKKVIELLERIQGSVNLDNTIARDLGVVLSMLKKSTWHYSLLKDFVWWADSNIVEHKGLRYDVSDVFFSNPLNIENIIDRYGIVTPVKHLKKSLEVDTAIIKENSKLPINNVEGKVISIGARGLMCDFLETYPDITEQNDKTIAIEFQNYLRHRGLVIIKTN